MKRYTLPAVCLILLAPFLWSKDFWEKSFEEWSQKDVSKMLTDSPWAEKYIRTRNLGGKGSGIGGEKEIFDTLQMRFFTALPVRHGYYRLLQLMNNYAAMDGEGREIFQQKFSAILRLDTSRQIIVATEFSSNDRELVLRMDRYLNTVTAELFKQNATLISDRLGRIPIVAYYPPSPDGTGAKFVFPREVDGKPTVSPEDKEVKFELILPEVGRLLITKKVKKMIYQGKLEI